MVTVGLIYFNSLADVNTVQRPVDTSVQESELLDRLTYLGGTNTKGLSIVYSSKLTDEARGEYDQNTNTIYVLQGREQRLTDRTIAHEYLHFIWDEALSDQERVDIDNKTEALYQRDADMQKRMEYYVGKGSFSYQEVFVIYCTESTDSYMLTIVEVCNKYIDRSKLVLVR